MKKLFISLAMVVLVGLTFSASDSFADERVTVGSVFKFTAGIITAFSIHEATHAVVAEACDIDLDWEACNYNQPLAFTEYGTSDSKGLALYSSGLISQLVGSEIVLRNDKIDKNSAFVRGMMIYNIVNPLLYFLDYELIHYANKNLENGFHQGDLEGVEHYSSKKTANVFAFATAGVAINQGVRFLKTQLWVPDWVKSESVQLNFEPIYLSQGRDVMGLKLVFHFSNR